MALVGALLENQFAAFSKFGDSKSDGKTITLTNSDKWMKQANVIDGKRITTTDTGIAFNKYKSKTIDFATFKKFVEDLASQKKMAADELFQKLTNCGAPGTSHTTKTTHVGGVDHLTDTSKYTGSHKERFDESGQGRGIAGRSDAVENTGYVQGYKGKDTYDKDKKQ